MPVVLCVSGAVFIMMEDVEYVCVGHNCLPDVRERCHKGDVQTTEDASQWGGQQLVSTGAQTGAAD